MNKSRFKPRTKPDNTGPAPEFQTRFIHYVSLVIYWMTRVYDSRCQQSYRIYFPLLLKLDRVLHNRGNKGLITYVKALRGQLLNYLSGSKERFPGVGVTFDGIPLAFGNLIDQIRVAKLPGSVLPVLNTILFSTRSLKPRGKASTESITAPGLQGIRWSDFSRWVIPFWREVGYRRWSKKPKSLDWVSFHLSTKAGPNGHAMWTYLIDLCSLPDSFLEDIKEVGGPKLARVISFLKDNLLAMSTGGDLPCYKGINRKIISFSDMEGKQRVVAILDYFSQSCLKPFHHWVFRALKKIPQDRTFSQSGFLGTFDDYQGVIYSVDLKDATDRFPLEFISLVLRGVLPEKYISSWVNLMVGLPFSFKGKEISYSVGNPMGAYSSWATFTIAHHYVVYWCCRELGIPWASYKYCLLGDDIVLTREDMGELYIKVMGDLGVEISSQKTHRSAYFFEFAKRYFYREDVSHKFSEITPFPISALRESSKRSFLLTQLLLELEGKSWVTKSVPDAVSLFYDLVLHFRAKMIPEMRKKAETCESITKVIGGSLPANEGINNLIRQYGLPCRDLNLDEANAIIQSSIRDMFIRSDPRRGMYEEEEPFIEGLRRRLSEQTWNVSSDPLTLLLSSGPRSTANLVQDSNPTLTINDRLEKVLISIQNEVRNLYQVSGGQWPLLFRSYCLPHGTSIYTMRTVQVKFFAFYAIGSTVLDFLRAAIQMGAIYRMVVKPNGQVIPVRVGDLRSGK